jgi:sugar lactone lactonase YvrE
MVRVLRAAAVLVVALTITAPARAQLSIGTLVGRQIGDGRQATAASLDRPFGVAFAPDGALLIADRRHARIRRVDLTTGIIETIVGTFPGTRNGVAADQGELKDPLRVRVDATTGDLVITDTAAHTVRRVVTATGLLVRIAGTTDTSGATGDGAPATSALLNEPTDAFPDGAGNVLIADRLNHKIRRIDALGNIETVTGTGIAGYTGDTVVGGATLAQLNAPACILPVPPAQGGGFYFCDQLNHVIRHVSADATVTTVAGNGVAGLADGPALTAQLNNPVNLAFDAAGNLLIADEDNNAIRRLDLTAGTLSTVAGTGDNQFSPDGSPAATSTLAGPTAVTLAPDGRIVFAEDEGHRVRAIDAGGNLVTLAGDGVNRFGGDGEAAVDAQLNQTKSVTRDLADRLIVADDGNARVRRVDPCTGLIETIAGNGTRAFSGDGGPALDAGLTASDALVDAEGNLIISDTDNNRVRVVDAEGNINTLVGTGAEGFSGDDGPATAATLNHPTGLHLDAAGNLYIADFDNGAVRKLTGGTITTVAGTGVLGYNGDDIPATTAMLNQPTDMEVDEAGNLYIADFGGHRIRRVDAATGLITTVAGTGVAGDGGDGGPATAALLNQPSDVKLDPSGALVVSDFGNQRIRRFTVGGSIEAVAGSGLRGYAGDGGPVLDARLLSPLRLLVIAADQILVAERDNFVVRLLGTLTTDCTKVPDDCRGAGAQTCIPGGGKQQRDCFAEFKHASPVPGSVPAPTLSCVDGDPSCDADPISGSCTFRLAVCLNNEDSRLPCSPGPITSLRLKGNQGKSAAGTATASAIGAFASSTSIAKGRGVTFASAFTEPNRCTPYGQFVVQRKGAKKGKGKLGALAVTQGAGKDKDKLKLVCLPPS